LYNIPFKIIPFPPSKAIPFAPSPYLLITGSRYITHMIATVAFSTF
jgi:hypothetical protein